MKVTYEETRSVCDIPADLRYRRVSEAGSEFRHHLRDLETNTRTVVKVKPEDLEDIATLNAFSGRTINETCAALV